MAAKTPFPFLKGPNLIKLVSNKLPRTRLAAADRRFFSQSHGGPDVPGAFYSRAPPFLAARGFGLISSRAIVRRGVTSWSKSSDYEANQTSTTARTSSQAPFILLAAACAVFGACLNGVVHAEAPPADHVFNAVKDDDLTVVLETGDIEDASSQYRLADVTQHDRHADRKWVVRGNTVYDITDFIEAHPGGEVILRACGGDVDVYWKFFTIHHKKDVEDILSQYQIGEIDTRDLNSDGSVNWKSIANQDLADPFAGDPTRDDRLIQHTAKPCNAETPADLLMDFLTPIRLWFVRNHLWVPDITPNSHEVTVELSNGDSVKYTLADLRKFPQHTITATLQCSGNRRAHMAGSARGKTSGLPWDVGAIGTAEWTGVRLRDVLRDAGYDPDLALQRKCTEADFEDQHVHFTAPGDTYAASIPLCTALSPTADVLLAFEMNGQPLTRDHGGPLRALIPGVTAARSVKWLGQITVAHEEASSQWQKKDYRIFPPDVKADQVKPADWEGRVAMQETPVQSAFAQINHDEKLDKTAAYGWAFSGGGRSIMRVDVSADGGKSWKEAVLEHDEAKGSRRWAWTRWKVEWSSEDIPASGEEREFVVRAVDDANNVQPPDFDSIWNFRGLCATAWDRRKG